MKADQNSEGSSNENKFYQAGVVKETASVPGKKLSARSFHNQTIHKLDPSKGGYYYLEVPPAFVSTLNNKARTRLICVIDRLITLRCGLNSLGNGNYFIIVATRYIKKLGKGKGQLVNFTLTEASDPLGVPIPEMLQALLEQEDGLKQVFDTMTDGKKRSLIFLVNRISDPDRYVSTAVKFLNDVKNGRSPFKQ